MFACRWSSLVISAAFLASLMYCTEFGFWLLDGIDSNTNNIALIFVVWAEVYSATVLYRHKDVIGQCGMPAFAAHQFGYIGGKIVGLAVGHTVSPSAGAGVGFGIYVVSVIVSLIISKTPDSVAPTFWGRNPWLSKFWWLGAYSVCRFALAHAAVPLLVLTHVLGQPDCPRFEHHRRSARQWQLADPVVLGCKLLLKPAPFEASYLTLLLRSFFDMFRPLCSQSFSPSPTQPSSKFATTPSKSSASFAPTLLSSPSSSSSLSHASSIRSYRGSAARRVTGLMRRR